MRDSYSSTILVFEYMSHRLSNLMVLQVTVRCTGLTISLLIQIGFLILLYMSSVVWMLLYIKVSTVFMG